MKKILLILLCMILLVGTVSAFEFDNIERYNETSRIFTIKNSILGIPFLELGTVAEIHLDTPDVVQIIRGQDRKVAEFTINNHGSYSNAFKKMEFYNIKKNMKEFDRDFTYKYKKSIGFETIDDYETICEDKVSLNGTKYKDCHQELTGTHQKEIFEWVELDTSELPKGKITVGIFTDVYAGDKVEWIPTLFGVRIDEWAVWSESLNVDLEHYYKLNESSGDAIDSIGNTDLTVAGAVQNVGGKIGTAYEFDGDDELGNFTINWSEDYSFCMWANTTTTGYDNLLYSKDNGNEGRFRISSTNKLQWSSISGPQLGNNGTDINDGDYHFLCGVRDNDVEYLYQDGVEIHRLATTANRGVRIVTIGGVIDETWVGNIDEISIYTRSLTAEEITQKYNGGSGITWTDVFIPEVTLNSPANDDDFLNPTIEFNCTSGDALAIINVSLLINGTIVQTNFSGINNADYLFTETITTGVRNYNWTCKAFNSLNLSTTADARNFTYSNNLAVSLVSPIEAYNSTSSSITFNGTASDDTAIINVSLYIDGILNETNSSGINNTDYIFTKIIVDGSHNWTYGACDVYGCLNATTRNISIDTTAPVMNITYPTATVNYHVINTNLTLNWTASDTHLDSCWYNYNGTNISVTCSDNTTQINITDSSNRNVTFYANDTFGNEDSDYQEWDYTIFENSQEFNNETLEGTINTFTANVTIGESNTITIANFIYNGTPHIGSFSQSGNDSILTIDLLAPNVDADINLTFFWSLVLSDSQIINLTSHNQTVTIISLDDCSVNTVVLYNYTIVDEGNQSLLSNLANITNTTAELSINLLDPRRQNYIFNFSLKYERINPFAVCINKDLLSLTYVVDSIVKYEALGYSIEYYNIVNATISNSTIPENITLYDLSSADATEFKITFKAEDFTFVENALIYIDRQYIAENNTFKTVELPKTDSNGQTIGHFVRNDIVYNIRVIKGGVVLGNFKNIIAFCEDYAIGACQIVLEATPADFDFFDYDEQLGIIFQTLPTYNENTSAISFDFSTDDGTIKTVLMEVTRDDIFGNRSICNNTITSSSGTLSCSFDPNIDDSTLRVSIFVDDQPIVLSNVKLESSVYGNLGYVLWFFLTFLFLLLFAHSKTEILIGLSISFIGAISLGITRGDIIGLGSAGIWVLVIVILGIYKLNKDKPQ